MRGGRRDSVSSLRPVQINHEASSPTNPWSMVVTTQTASLVACSRPASLQRINYTLPFATICGRRGSLLQCEPNTVYACASFLSYFCMAANGATIDHSAVRLTLLVLTIERGSIVFFSIGFKPLADDDMARWNSPTCCQSRTFARESQENHGHR